MLFLVQEWPEEDYPPYANGAGYIISSDIAQFIVSEFEKHKLRVFDINALPLPINVRLCNHTHTLGHHFWRFYIFSAKDWPVTPLYSCSGWKMLVWECGWKNSIAQKLSSTYTASSSANLDASKVIIQHTINLLGRWCACGINC